MSVTFSPIGSRVNWDKEDGSWANFANGNAFSMLRLLGLPLEEWGQIEATEVGGIRQRILVLLNKESARAPAVRETVTMSGPGQATLVTQGIDDGYLRRRLEDFDRVLEACQSAGVGMGWG